MNSKGLSKLEAHAIALIAMITLGKTSQNKLFVYDKYRILDKNNSHLFAYIRELRNNGNV